MRTIFSEKLKELDQLVSPYLVQKGVEFQLRDDAPEEIKKAKEELDRLFEKEYQKEI